MVFLFTRAQPFFDFRVIEITGEERDAWKIGVSSRDSDHAHTGGKSGRDAAMGVFENHALVGGNTEEVGGAEIDVGMRLRIGNLVAVDDRQKKTNKANLAEDE